MITCLVVWDFHPCLVRVLINPPSIWCLCVAFAHPLQSSNFCRLIFIIYVAKTSLYPALCRRKVFLLNVIFTKGGGTTICRFSTLSHQQEGIRQRWLCLKSVVFFVCQYVRWMAALLGERTTLSSLIDLTLGFRQQLSTNFFVEKYPVGRWNSVMVLSSRVLLGTSTFAFTVEARLSFNPCKYVVGVGTHITLSSWSLSICMLLSPNFQEAPDRKCCLLLSLFLAGQNEPLVGRMTAFLLWARAS